MGHCIEYATCGNSEVSRCIKKCTAHAYDPEETCCYHGNMRVHRDIICENKEEAYKMIEKLDNGWYSDHAVRYKDGRKLRWLIKYEWHC